MQETSANLNQDTLAAKVERVFGALAIDKRRLPGSQLKQRGIPSYVAEWVLDNIVPGSGPLTEIEAVKVQEWAAKAIPGADDKNIFLARLQRGDIIKVLTPVQINIILNRKREDRLASLSLIGIEDAHVSEELGLKYPGLLKQGMWGIVELMKAAEGVAITSFRPMQATVDLELWKKSRCEFTLSEWRSLLMLSMGYSPAAYTEDEQTLLLCRLLPLVQKNTHLMELAPKGTGKSYIYENISPMVRLVSTPVSPAVLFVNNANGLPGILARYKVVVLDEIQSLKFDKPEEIIGGLKDYLANGQLTRGGLHQLSSDCGLVMLGNISLDSNQQPLADPIVRELRPFMQETAFLDRFCGIIPGWEIQKLPTNGLAASVGLKSDFFGDVLIALREEPDPVSAVNIRLTEGCNTIRNGKSVRALASGLHKLLFPNGECCNADFERYCVAPALRLRQIVWNQLYSLDAEYRQYMKYLSVETVK